MRKAPQLAAGLGLSLALAAGPAMGAGLRDPLLSARRSTTPTRDGFSTRLSGSTRSSPSTAVSTSPHSILCTTTINEAEFSVGDFELNYRMHHRAGRAIKAVLEGAVDEATRNEAAFRLARIHFQKTQLDDASHALARIEGAVPEER